MLVSFTPGRVRLRGNAYKDEAYATKLMKAAKKLPGFKKAERNAVTGSIIIKYDAEMLEAETVEEFQQAVKSAMPSMMKNFMKEQCKNKSFNRAMFITLVLCAASPIFGAYALHKYSGVFLLGMMATHIKDYSKHII